MAPTSFSPFTNDRYCPVLAGHALQTGRSLQIRVVGAEIAVDAPPVFLTWLWRLCDGTRTLRDIEEALPGTVDRTKFFEFLAFLAEQGALIDGRVLTAHALRYGYQMSPYGESESAGVTDAIGRRAKETAAGAPIETLPERFSVERWRKRASVYTFDDTPVTRQQLVPLLWSLCGEVAAEGARREKSAPHRTIASAGALHLLQAFLVLQQPVGNYSPGVYRIRYPAAECVALELVGQALPNALCRLFAQPWHLQCATGAVFVAADAALAASRYRNRALQYLFMEAGAALHNGALTAPGLGLGFATLGCYDESAVQALCSLGEHIVLGAAVFGPSPTDAQMRKARRPTDLEFAWVDAAQSDYRPPFHLGRARPKYGPAQDYAWGCDADPAVALRKAAAESVERQGFLSVRDVTFGRLQDFDFACHPDVFVRYQARQYASPRFPLRRFETSGVYGWISGVRYGSGESVWVPADFVHSAAALRAVHGLGAAPLTYATTSGCAAGATLHDAFERALLELVERDAFMRHWLAQCPGKAISIASLPEAVRTRLVALEAAGCKVGVQWLTSRFAPVALAWAQHAERHFTTLGTAAHIDPESAILAALAELESRVFVWLNGLLPSRSLRPTDVRQPSHHFTLYGLPRHFRRADALWVARETVNLGEVTRSPWPVQPSISDRFLTAGLKSILIDITPEQHWIDQGRTALTVVRALVPSLLPMSFGYGLEPLGMVDFVHPGARFPHPFP